VSAIKPTGNITKKKADKKAKPFVSLVIPAYNEERIIEKNLNEICNYMKKLEVGYLWELVVVDDGSKDSTGAILDNFAKNKTNVCVIHHIANMRLAQALKTAFQSCKGDYIITLDADLSYNPDHIEKLISKITETKAQVVIASPYMKEGSISNVPWLRKLLSRWANKFLSFFARGNLHTLTGMVRAYDRKFLCALDLKADDVDINAEIIYKTMLLRGRIIEIPAHLNWNHTALNGKHRNSSFKILPSLSRYFFSGFIFRPFMFFVIMGYLLLFISLYPLTWALIHTLKFYNSLAVSSEPLDYRFSEAIAAAFQQSPHAFLIGGFILMLSIQFISLGILAMQYKHYFEELFHLGSTIYKKSLTS